jgi:hypothetical protein
MLCNAAIYTDLRAFYLQIVSVTALILGELVKHKFTQRTHSCSPVQGWSSVIPRFSALEFASFYIEIPVMLLMCIAWMATHIPRIPSATADPTDTTPLLPNKQEPERRRCRSWWGGDLVDHHTVNLVRDEYEEGDVDKAEDDDRAARQRWGRLALEGVLLDSVDAIRNFSVAAPHTS